MNQANNWQGNDNLNNTQANTLEALLQAVLAQQMQPEDRFEIAAILESFGWNDAMVAEVFGVEDIFELSQQLWNASQNRILYVPASNVKELNLWEYSLMILKGFLRGAIFALPMAVSIVAMLTLRFSLWSYTYLSLENATSIAIGTILSFVSVGGFTQAIAYWGFRYIGQDQYYMARKLVFYYVRLGFILCLIIAGLVFLFNFLFVVFPWRMTIVIILYFLFLSAIWLSVTIMYILRKELMFSGLIVGGIFLVFIFFKLLKWDIIISQVIALLLISIAGILIARYFFIRAENVKEKGINPHLPRLSVIFHISLPYFTYGILYFIFIFTDRLVAWSTNNDYMPFLIWFRGEYELGLDLALIVMILPMGLVEAVVTELMLNLEANQKNHMAEDIGRLNTTYVWMYLRRITYVTVFSLANVLTLYFITKYFSQGGVFGTEMFFQGTTHFVFIWALIGYAIVSVALMNALIMFCLSQPQLVYRSIMYACVTNLSLGFLLSRWVDYSWAVLGLVVGALVFTFISSRQVLIMLSKLDYYLYSAS